MKIFVIIITLLHPLHLRLSTVECDSRLYSAFHNQNAVPAYLKSKQILSFGCTRQYNVVFRRYRLLLSILTDCHTRLYSAVLWLLQINSFYKLTVILTPTLVGEERMTTCSTGK